MKFSQFPFHFTFLPSQFSLPLDLAYWKQMDRFQLFTVHFQSQKKWKFIKKICCDWLCSIILLTFYTFLCCDFDSLSSCGKWIKVNLDLCQNFHWEWIEVELSTSKQKVWNLIFEDLENWSELLNWKLFESWKTVKSWKTVNSWKTVKSWKSRK